MLTLLLSAGGLGVALAASGEALCEDKQLTSTQCAAVGCCEWDGACFSAVSAVECEDSSGADIVLPTYAKGAFEATWVPGAGNFDVCGRTTSVFGVTVCVTAKAWSGSMDKCNHIAHVLAQLLDNDADGVADDETVVKYMNANTYYLAVPFDEEDEMPEATKGTPQMTGVFEAVPNSCDTPSNRGASNTDRSTWPSARENTPGATGCDPERDATTEEALHLITDAAARVWPAKWGATKDDSAAGVASFSANGNCGWGYAGTFKNPSGANPPCAGQYAYSDTTCGVSCVVTEGIYWASVTWMGGLFTDARALAVADEWLMTVPDTGMAAAVPAGQANAKTLQEGSAALFDLVSDTTSVGHNWLPSVMPNGKYVVTSDDAAPGEGVDGDSSASAMAVGAAAVAVAAVAATVTAFGI